MKLVIRYGFLLLITVLLASCFSKSKLSKNEQDVDESLRETQYYRAFTDATKHALFGNNKTAISLYNACIHEYPERAASYYQLSTIYLRENEFDKAVSYSRKACEKDTTNRWYKIHLASIYQYLGNLDSSILLYEKLVDHSANTDEMKYNLAMMYSQEKRDQEAIKTLENISEDNRNSREILLMEHNAFHNLQEYDSAVYILEKIIALFPDDVNNYGMLAEYLTEIGRLSYAKRVYHEILNEDPGNGLALLSFAEHYMKKEEKDSAFYYYRKAFCCSDLEIQDKISVIVTFLSNKDFIRENKRYVLDLMNEIDKKDRAFSYYAARADIYINLEEYLEAKPYLDSALIYEKDNYMVWEQTLLINNMLNNDEDIVRIATEALKHFHDKPNLFLIRANSYRHLEEDDLAITDLDSVLHRDINQAQQVQAYNFLAEIYRDKGEYEQSDSCFEAILQIDPKNLVVKNNYAYYLSLREDQLEKALEMSKYTIDRDPENPTFLDTYGWILYKLGRLKEAKTYIELAIRNGAYENVEVLEHYGDIMKDMNKCNEAIEAYETILNIHTDKRIESKIEEVKQDCK